MKITDLEECFIYRLRSCQKDRQLKKLGRLVQMLRSEMQSWSINLKIQSVKWTNFKILYRGLLKLLELYGIYLGKKKGIKKQSVNIYGVWLWPPECISVTVITLVSCSLCQWHYSLPVHILSRKLLLARYQFLMSRHLAHRRTHIQLHLSWSSWYLWSFSTFFGSGLRRNFPIQSQRIKSFVSKHWPCHPLGNNCLHGQRQLLFRY